MAARYKKSVESTGDLTAEDEDADRAVMPKAIRYGSLDTAKPGGTCSCIAAARRRRRDSLAWQPCRRSPSALHAGSCDQSSFDSSLTLLSQACRQNFQLHCALHCMRLLVHDHDHVLMQCLAACAGI